MLTQAKLRQVLHYEPQTGVFTWTKGLKKGSVAGTVHDERGFLKVSIASKRYLLHRLAFLWMTGAMPRSNVEHIDGNHQNNSWQNLREGERSQKRAYRPTYREPTAIQGVYQIGDRFEAMIPVQGIVLNVGAFPTAQAAGEAIRALRRNADKKRRKILTEMA